MQIRDVPLQKAHGDPKLKIAFYSPLISGRGGVEMVLTNLIHGLERQGDLCRLYILGGSPHKAWLQNIPWSLEIGGPSQPRPVRLFSYMFQSVRYLRSWKPDVIVCCDTTTVRMARWSLRIAGIKGVPVVCWLHCSYRFLRMQNEVARADANFCICRERADEVRELLLRTGDKATAEKPVFIVYSGTSEGANPAIKRAAIPTFVFAGRVQYAQGKRIQDLIEAAALLTGDFRIKLLGDGYEEEKQKIRERSRELGIEHKIQWLGWHKNAWDMVGEASAMVLPSDAEGFSMVTIEALARGLPAIIADFGGIATEAVLPEKTGWIFPIADVPALAAILQSILDDSSILPDADTIRNFARRFSTEQMVTNFTESVQNIIAAKAIAER